MKNIEFVDAGTACDLLGVQPQTLYAYVSRGYVRAKADVRDTRRSLYALADLEDLLRKKRRPRARADIANAAIRWGDPVLETSISDVRDGMLWFRGLAVTDCAETMTLEDVAAHLIGVRKLDMGSQRAKEDGATPFARAMIYLSRQTSRAHPIASQSIEEMAHEAVALLSAMGDVCLVTSEGGLLHERVARAWALDGSGADMVRRALVLLSDHELNPSTFAVRVCASAGASLPAALLAGMATLSGVRHGSTSALASLALEEACEGRIDRFLASEPAHDPYSFGFGHPLYPSGDPRARAILERLPQDSTQCIAVRQLSDRLNTHPNVDMALTALVSYLALPSSAAQTLFAISRFAGWAAHAIEQGQRVEIIRPRARYVATGP